MNTGQFRLVPPRLQASLADPIQVNSILIVVCFAAILGLSSQSAASYPSYLLALSMLFTVRRWNDVFPVPVLWFLVALLGWLCLSSFWSEPFSARDAFGILGRALLVLLFVVAVAECELRGLVQQWLGRALAIVGALSAGAAIVVYVRDIPHDGRLSGLGQLDNPVVAGLVFGAVCILLLEVLFSDPSRRWKVVAAVCGVFVLLAVALSGSRNAWVSTAVGGLVLTGSRLIRDPRRFIAATATLSFVAMLSLLALFLTEQGADLLFPRADSFRVAIWSQIVERIQEHPWLGLGILTPDGVEVGHRSFSHPHNMYLAVAFQGGLVALVLFLFLISSATVVLLRSYEQRSAKLALGLLAMALSAYLLDGHELIDKVGETWFLFWLPVALALGLAWRDTLSGARAVDSI